PGRDAEQPAEPELVAAALLPDPVVPAAVVGVGEVDAAVVATGDDVVRAVQVRAPVVEGDEVTPPVGAEPDETARDLFADEQAPVVVEGHAVALEGRARGDLHPALLGP